jgi:hypothetical protein
VGTDGLVSNGTSKGRGVFVTIDSSVPGPPTAIPGSHLLLDGVSCPTSTACIAVGTNGTAQVVSLTVS